MFSAEAPVPVGDLAVLHGLYRLTVNACARAPLTFIVDDVQHADQPTVARLTPTIRPVDCAFGPRSCRESHRLVASQVR